MLIIAGWLQVATEDQGAYLADCRGVVEQARRAPGCLDFVLAADPVEPGRIAVYERWTSDEALHAFRGSGPSDEQSQQILGAEVRKYRISATEDP